MLSPPNHFYGNLSMQSLKDLWRQLLVTPLEKRRNLVTGFIRGNSILSEEEVEKETGRLLEPFGDKNVQNEPAHTRENGS